VAYSWERVAESEKAAILRSITLGEPPPPPRVVELSWQDRCNIDCFFCSTAELRAGNRELSRDRLETLFDEMQTMGVQGVRLMGGGEPLFRRDGAELIASLGRRGLRITDVTTNGVLLTETVTRALFSTGCDEICVSLNAGNADSYATMMQTTGKNFDRVVENVRRAAAIKRQIGARCAIKVQFLVYRDNYRQLPEMYQVFRETGADAFWFNGLYPVRPMPGMDESDIERMIELYEQVLAQDYFAHLERFSFWEQPVADRIAAAERRVFSRAPLARRARTKIRRVLTRGRRREREASSLHEFCLVGWYSTTINANGDVVTCCILQDRKGAVLGNIASDSLTAIWHGEAYGRFRAELREIMARRGDIGSPGHALCVESICAEKGACPARSYYWAQDLPFRRAFHASVEGMEAPAGEPFATLGSAPSRSLPIHPQAAAPVR
jgi:MoaA/NifB/PqqE/SkfB family radical SAM enzyme